MAWLAEHEDELEAERLRQHEKKMREWRENSRQIRETIAQNRRELGGKPLAAPADWG